MLKHGLTRCRGRLSEEEAHDHYIDFGVWDDDWSYTASKLHEEEDDWWDPMYEWDD